MPTPTPSSHHLPFILPLSIQIILLHESQIFRIRRIIILVLPRRLHPSHPIITPRHRRLARRRLLRNSVARIDPVGVHINRRAEVVDVCLEGLTADFALQVADAGFLFNADGDGVLVVAEEALEGAGELLLLHWGLVG
jgi:hypothetical protein